MWYSSVLLSFTNRLFFSFSEISLLILSVFAFTPIQPVWSVRWTRRDIFIHIISLTKTEQNSVLLVDFHEQSFLYKIISNYNHSHQFHGWNYMYKNVTSGPLYISILLVYEKGTVTGWIPCGTPMLVFISYPLSFPIRTTSLTSLSRMNFLFI